MCCGRAWLENVLPMVLDRETSVQEKCLETLQSVLLSNLVPAHRSLTAHHQMAWQLVAIMAGDGCGETR